MLPVWTVALLFVSQVGDPAAYYAPPVGMTAAVVQYQPVAYAQPVAPAAIPGLPNSVEAAPRFQITAAEAAASSDPAYVTQEELQAQLKKWSWSKGDFKIVPYGTVWGSMSYDSQRSRIGDYSLWIESPNTHYHESDYNVDAKSTRFGTDVFGPTLPFFDGLKVDGKVEIDFQGQFATRNKPGLLLRHAYIEAKNDEWRFLVGQTWDVISPLYLPTLNYTCGSAVGNLGYRRAQFRVERYVAVSDTSLVTLQSALAANSVTDFVTDTTVSADPGPYPDVQCRAGWTVGERTGPEAHPIVVGVSGHIGEQDFDFRSLSTPDLGLRIKTWSLDGDILIPFSQNFGFQGEFFTGSNLSNYMGGIMQGVDRVTHRGIHSTGGWFDIYCNWRPDLHTHSGFAIDDPCDTDLVAAGSRTRNQTIFSNVIYDATSALQFGFEVDVWQTGYLNMQAGRAVRLEFATKYKF
ncbi:MAG: hypothetical protein WCJ35_04230 [Planctomycetota bacterium]